jgi:hypothetical protein
MIPSKYRIFFIKILFLLSIMASCSFDALADMPDADGPYTDLLSNIPEPMVFDLVRSLGARQGELEINTLVLFPLRDRGRTRSFRDTDGTIKDTSTERIDWAPEIEYAVWDDFALEFELPFEDEKLVAYKFAYQWTFGSMLNDTVIHGSQGIAEYNRFTEVTELTLIYLTGIIISPEWNMLTMFGVRGEAGGQVERSPFEMLINATIFYILDDINSFGLELNIATTFNEGESSVLVMPQWGVELSEHWSIQTGIGVQISDERTLPLASSRLIWTY